MNHLIFILAIFFLQDIPFKPKDEFEIKIDYQFKPRPLGDHNTVLLGNDRNDERRSTSLVLPYLTLNLRILSLPGEKMRLRINTNLNDKGTLKKINVNTVFALDMGFTDDIKDRVSAHEYTLILTAADKTPVEKIVISVDEDGAFFVNGEKHGKF